jgi:4-hydroxyacetophenone monooxygenase
VKLLAGGIRAITARGIVSTDGSERPADSIIYATGFQASQFLTPMQVLGRNGADLHEQWDGNARAYLGVVAPNFPNLFFLYGPNTNIVVNGSVIYFSECEMHYIVNAIRMLLETGVGALDCKQSVHDRYNAWIDDGNSNMAWGVSRVNSWYKSASGRVAQNWPFTLLEYWQQTRSVNAADYTLT